MWIEGQQVECRVELDLTRPAMIVGRSVSPAEVAARGSVSVSDADASL
jgi:hypothetical protein